jgi:AraC-like DNA-binding protein
MGIVCMITDAVRERILELRGRGLTIAETADLAPCSESTVKRVLSAAAQRAPQSATQGPIDIFAELEKEIRAVKPSSVRVSALVALDRIRRQGPAPAGPDVVSAGPTITVFGGEIPS